MKQTRVLMGMPITVEVLDLSVTSTDIDDIYKYFDGIDHQFSVYKADSEISRINQGKLKHSEYSADMTEIFKLCAETKMLSRGYFNIDRKGKLDPSGLVKGWAILKASQILDAKKLNNYFIEAGGDIQSHGLNSQQQPWTVGIRNPFNINEIVKKISLKNIGVATSGTYFRGQHIYNPQDRDRYITDVISLSVIGPNIYEADRFATAAFAMGQKGINFISTLKDFEAYQIDNTGHALYTPGFNNFVIN